MIYIEALLRLINTNNDNVIQREEAKSFLKTQNKSIFTEFLKTIKSDMDIETFQSKLFEINDNAPENYDLSFKDDSAAKEYESIKEQIDYKLTLHGYFGYYFESDDIFDMEFFKILSTCKNNENWKSVICNELEKFSKSASQLTIIKRLNTGNFDYVDNSIQDIIFDDIDLSEYKEAFKYITFNEKTFANVSPEHLPEGFNPKEIIEKGKSIGLGIENVHNMGYTGQGISFAVIDSDGVEHSAIKFKEYHGKTRKELTEVEFHGFATSYIAQEIAPNADMYYYGDNNTNDETIIAALKDILEKNKTLPENQKIRFVSMSMPLYGGDKAQQIVNQLEEQGVWVYYSGSSGDFETRFYTNKINPNGDQNDFNNYELPSSSIDGMKSNSAMILVNAGNRTVPDPSGVNAWRHDTNASQSWSIPVIAGYYTLACQADPTMTKERFMILAEQTGYPLERERVYENDEGVEIKEKVYDKMINIKALLEEIERQKTVEQ